MEYSPIRHHGRITRSFTIENGPTLPCAHTSKRFQAERITIAWELGRGGDWVVTSRYSIDVSGSVLKKDGTPGRVSHTRFPGGEWTGHGLIIFTAGWEWIGELIVQNAPIGKITLPAVS